MGGGGGSGRDLTPQEVRRLEELAREQLRKVQPERRNAFLSFASEDLAEVNLLRGQAKNANSDIEFNDWSLREPFDSKNAEYIKRGIRERIRQSSVLIVYVSDHTADSRWVDWEIRESKALGKGVVAMHKGDKRPAKLPAVLREFKVPVVSWNQEQLAKAIERAAKS